MSYMLTSVFSLHLPSPDIKANKWPGFQLRPRPQSPQSLSGGRSKCSVPNGDIDATWVPVVLPLELWRNVL